MTHQVFPTPKIAPFERLHVYDSLMMNADRWHLAQNYHRRRQNVYYQSLNQPGIVCGLGVNLTAAPESAPSQFRDRRWIEIQPGIAIDVEGNLIVVQASLDERKFRIALKPPASGAITVYIVLSYREPELSEANPYPEKLTERFRFDQKTEPPSPHEIELCRIQLKPGIIELENPTDVFFPGANQLDLRYRLQAQTRPQAVVQLAQVQPLYVSAMGDRTAESLAALMESVSVLYPALQGVADIETVTLDRLENATPYDVLYLSDSHVMNLEQNELTQLNQYLQGGGVLFVEAAFASGVPVENVIAMLEQHLETTLEFWQTLKRNCPLRSRPFLFSALPNIGQEVLKLWHGGGIVFVKGELSSAWGVDENYSRFRNDIRTAQEFGINILHLAWNRRWMTRLLNSGEKLSF